MAWLNNYRQGAIHSACLIIFKIASYPCKRQSAFLQFCGNTIHLPASDKICSCVRRQIRGFEHQPNMMQSGLTRRHQSQAITRWGKIVLLLHAVPLLLLLCSPAISGSQQTLHVKHGLPLQARVVTPPHCNKNIQMLAVISSNISNLI